MKTYSILEAVKSPEGSLFCTISSSIILKVILTESENKKLAIISDVVTEEYKHFVNLTDKWADEKLLKIEN